MLIDNELQTLSSVHLQCERHGRSALRLRLGCDRWSEAVLRTLLRHQPKPVHARCGHDHCPRRLPCGCYGGWCIGRPLWSKAVAYDCCRAVHCECTCHRILRRFCDVQHRTLHRRCGHRCGICSFANVYCRSQSSPYPWSYGEPQPDDHRARHPRCTDRQHAFGTRYHRPCQPGVEPRMGLALDVLGRNAACRPLPCDELLHSGEPGVFGFEGFEKFERFKRFKGFE